MRMKTSVSIHGSKLRGPGAPCHLVTQGSEQSTEIKSRAKWRWPWTLVPLVQAVQQSRLVLSWLHISALFPKGAKRPIRLTAWPATVCLLGWVIDAGMVRVSGRLCIGVGSTAIHRKQFIVRVHFSADVKRPRQLFIAEVIYGHPAVHVKRCISFL